MNGHLERMFSYFWYEHGSDNKTFYWNKQALIIFLSPFIWYFYVQKLIQKSSLATFGPGSRWGYTCKNPIRFVWLYVSFLSCTTCWKLHCLFFCTGGNDTQKVISKGKSFIWKCFSSVLQQNDNWNSCFAFALDDHPISIARNDPELTLGEPVGPRKSNVREVEKLNWFLY